MQNSSVMLLASAPTANKVRDSASGAPWRQEAGGRRQLDERVRFQTSGGAESEEAPRRIALFLLHL